MSRYTTCTTQNTTDALTDHFADLLWNLDHGVATDAELQYAEFLGLDLTQYLADFPHYARALDLMVTTTQTPRNR